MQPNSNESQLVAKKNLPRANFKGNPIIGRSGPILSEFSPICGFEISHIHNLGAPHRIFRAINCRKSPQIVPQITANRQADLCELRNLACRRLNIGPEKGPKKGPKKGSSLLCRARKRGHLDLSGPEKGVILIYQPSSDFSLPSFGTFAKEIPAAIAVGRAR